MRQFIYACLLVAALFGASSCISSSDSETTTYGDAAITSFSLSSYTDYPFTIDQVNHTIFNIDSLPAGTDVSRLAVSVVARNSGTIVLKSVVGDTLTYYNSEDSLDFTQPRRFIVYANNGSGNSEYLVKVNVHRQKGDTLVWTLTGNDWTQEPAPEVAWPGIRQWIGRGRTEQYALSDDNLLMVSTDDGNTWQAEPLDDDASLLPTEEVAMVSYPMYYALNTDYVLLVGYRSRETYPQESTAKVWRKIVDRDKPADATRWTYIERSADAVYQLPQLDGLALVYYDDGVLAFGKPYDVIYQSRDNGITWKKNAVYKMPEGFDAADGDVKVSVDADNFIWLYCAGSGQIWRGRLNRLGWD